MDDILRRHRQGDLSAAGEFKRLFVFGDELAAQGWRYRSEVMSGRERYETS